MTRTAHTGYPLDNPGERFLLVMLRAPNRATSFPEKYRHIDVHVVRRAVADQPSNSGPTFYYDGRSPTGFRWADYTSTSTRGLYVKNLRISAQITVGERDKSPYCPTIEFVGDTKLKEMLPAAKTVKRLTATAEKHGRSVISSSGELHELLETVREALGIRNYLCYEEAIDYGHLERSRFLMVQPDDLQFHIQRLTHEAHSA